LYAIAGKIAIYILQIFPKEKLPYIGKYFTESKFLYELFSCELCLGVWIYTILAFFFKANIYDSFYVPVISEALTGISTSFLVHLVSEGWRSKYSVIEIR